MVMKAKIAPCPRCRRFMHHELDRDVYRCINCAEVFTRLDLANWGFIYPTSKTIKQLAGF